MQVQIQTALDHTFTQDSWLINIQKQLLKKNNLSIDEIPWGTRVRDKGIMDNIKVSDVTEKLDMFHNYKDRT